MEPKDDGSLYIDYLRIEAISRGKKNIEFREYLGTEHNFFPVDENGVVNQEVFNWDKVVQDWFDWLSRNGI